MSGIDALAITLLARARNAVGAAFSMPPVAAADHPRLHEPGASFVTLFTHGALRGCIGSLETTLPLDLDVAHNAFAAAFRDPRFAPLGQVELAHTRFEVSVLGPASPIVAATEADVVAALVPHRDGVTLNWRGQRATLLPQVWASLPDPTEFLHALKRKAGLPRDFWAADLHLDRYSVVLYEETPEAVA